LKHFVRSTCQLCYQHIVDCSQSNRTRPLCYQIILSIDQNEGWRTSTEWWKLRVSHFKFFSFSTRPSGLGCEKVRKNIPNFKIIISIFRDGGKKKYSFSLIFLVNYLLTGLTFNIFLRSLGYIFFYTLLKSVRSFI
jgi:hypothetical protein